jgi:hypothetical protein
MHRSRTPLEDRVARRAPVVRFVFLVSGTVTVLFAGSLVRPAPIEAQGLGTMQVMARVTPAGAAWDGLAAAQKAVRELTSARVVDGQGGTVQTSLAKIELQPATPPSGPRPRLAISIQYLRN